MDQRDDDLSISRRGFLIISGAATLPIAEVAAAQPGPRPTRRELKFKLDGRAMSAELEPPVTLLDFLWAGGVFRPRICDAPQTVREPLCRN